MDQDDLKLRKIMESGALAFNSGPGWGDFADFPQSNMVQLKTAEDDETDAMMQFVDSLIKKAMRAQTHTEISPETLYEQIWSFLSKNESFSSMLQRPGMEDLIRDYVKKTYEHTGMDFRDYPKNDN
ncbi:MAG: hypothetical protein V3W20_10390 [Candidatus Neomarinimicrobiota bacterium]